MGPDIISIVGARPQFIKEAALFPHLNKAGLTEKLVHTGQHYDGDLSSIFFSSLGIKEPEHNLRVGSMPHGAQTGLMLHRIEAILQKERPKIVLLYGDTNSTLAGALASAKLHIPIAHVEAGVRSYNRMMPEEINRVLTDAVSTLLFCPTVAAVENLSREGIEMGVHLVGDIMYDIFLKFKDKIRPIKEIDGTALPEKYVLMTLHRPVNTDDPDNLRSIIQACLDSSKNIVFPAHPRTVKCLSENGLMDPIISSDIMTILKPASYETFLSLILGSEKIMTDSGGVQKEAFFMSRPCITLRNETEWTDLVDNGWNLLAGADKNKILEALDNFHPVIEKSGAFGDGKAAKRIAGLLSEFLEHQS